MKNYPKMKLIQKAQTIDVFYPGLDDSPYYRIPVLLKLQDGRLLAGADQRNTTELDWGKINPVFCFKNTDGGFSSLQKIKELDDTDTKEAPFNIDICMVEQTKGSHAGRIYMLIDAFKSGGNYWNAEAGTGYREVNGKYFLQLFGPENTELLVDDSGKVYNSKLEATAFEVCFNDNHPFKSYGNLYENGKLIGNIYKDSSPYQVLQTAYLWMSYSDDGGSSWHKIVDLTPAVKDPKMKFIGTGPGRGVELCNGRLVFPIYFSVEDKTGEWKQSAAVVYTDDGINFKRSESVNDSNGYDALAGEYPINTSEAQLFQRENGDVWMFFRNDSGKVRYAISTDNCESFSDHYEVDFKSEPTCMLSVVYFNQDGFEYILLSNPKGPERTNGSIKLMIIIGQNQIKTIGEYPVNDTSFTYSCLEQLGENHFAILFEEQRKAYGEDRQHLRYFEFGFEE